MKTHRLITSAFVAASLSLPLAGANDPMPGAGSATQPYQRQAGEISIRRVSDDTVKQDVTAKDFIGKTIYDPAGEKLGEIIDVHLMAHLATTTARPNPAAASESPDRSGERRMNDNVVYVSVGGLLGVGDDVVSVPTHALQFDAPKDRFTLNVRKTDFVALAKQEAPAYAATARDPSPSYAGPTRPLPSTSTANDVTTVRNALQADQMVAKLASRITVTESDAGLTLSGKVDTQAQKDRIILIARAATAKPVTDRLTLAENP